MVKLFTLVGLVRGGLVNVSSHEKQILFQKLGANNHFVNLFQNLKFLPENGFYQTNWSASKYDF